VTFPSDVLRSIHVGAAPMIRYAKTSDDLHIAYQVVGDGPALVYMPHWATHLELLWEEPSSARVLRRLASFARLILFDKRGVGLSDPVPVPVLPTLETWCDDVLAVLEASRTEAAALVASDAGSFVAQLFAALHPSRTSALVLYGSAARLRRADDYPAGLPHHVVDAFLDVVEQSWGTEPVGLDVSDPSAARDESFRAWQTSYQRQSASPGTIMAMMRMVVEIDLRPILPSISTPTLVVHRSGDRWYPIAHGRYLAEHIPNAEFVELEGSEHDIAFGDSQAVILRIEEFLTGASHVPELDRILVTVLFTDIVASTSEASRLGDRTWHGLLDQHDALVQRQLGRYRGRMIKATGDGLLAIFDGPARAVRCAAAIRDALRGFGLDVRAGLHTGEVEMRDQDVTGLAVNIAQRVSSSAAASEILVSRTVVDLVAGSGIEFDARGERQLRGVPGVWQLYSVRA
jgi:class 3 adenylate cyclase